MFSETRPNAKPETDLTKSLRGSIKSPGGFALRSPFRDFVHLKVLQYAATIRAVAGPGSGKSFAIKRRILRLLEQKVNPERILAITFTRTAAQDLKTEISSLGVKGAEQVHFRTVHSHALRILMKEGVLEQTGRYPRMVIEHEQQPILRDIDREEFGGVRDKKQLLVDISVMLTPWQFWSIR